MLEFYNIPQITLFKKLLVLGNKVRGTIFWIRTTFVRDEQSSMFLHAWRSSGAPTKSENCSPFSQGTGNCSICASLLKPPAVPLSPAVTTSGRVGQEDFFIMQQYKENGDTVRRSRPQRGLSGFHLEIWFALEDAWQLFCLVSAMEEEPRLELCNSRLFP